MKSPKTLAITVAAILVAIVALQNTESVETRVLVFTLSTPRVVLLAVTFLVGGITGLLLGQRLQRGADREDSQG
jgi:uncharacterized integral membrane protein